MAKAKVTVTLDVPLAQAVSQAAAERGVRAVVLDAERVMKVMLSQPGSGRIYPRGKTGFHRASAPGEPPAPDTGRLRNSVQTEVFRAPGEVSGRVSVNTEYAAALELGTEKVKRRPYLSRLGTEYAGRLAAVFQRFAQ